MRPYTNSRCSVIQLSNPILQKHPPPNLSHHFTPGFVHVLKLVYNRSKTQTHRHARPTLKIPRGRSSCSGCQESPLQRCAAVDVCSLTAGHHQGQREGETPCCPTGASLELQSPAQCRAFTPLCEVWADFS